MGITHYPDAVLATDVALNKVRSVYPEPFASMMNQREKRRLGDVFALSNFGVNLTRLEPGGVSALYHAHSKQDEFVYVLAGCPTLKSGDNEIVLAPGMCAGFKAGSGKAHQLINKTNEAVCFLEVGDRSAGDQVTYPDDDIAAVLQDGVWIFTHKDGTPY
ncbi:MAG: Cupin 2 conserved barrel domain protein [Gammaproteobacteria bacterium]|jgi:uncharacterized cupin superfamily protein|nr:Cupin 2 conserved barrel domain protein [Gammaproteobacteria bacterium]